MNNQIKQKGNNNVALINSKVSIINHQDEILQLLNEGRTAEAAQKYSSFYKSAVAQHPYFPDWRYEIDNKNISKPKIIHVPTNKESITKYPMHVKMKFANQEELNNFSNLGEIINQLYLNQNSIELKAEYLRLFLGDLLMEEFESTESQSLSITIQTESFPPPIKSNLIVIESNDHKIIDTIEIGLKKIEDDMLIINNCHQLECDLHVCIEMNELYNRGKVNVNIVEEKRNNARSILKYIEFNQLMKNNSSLCLSEFNSNEIYFSANFDNTACDLNYYSDDYTEILSNIVKIEDYFDINFSVQEIFNNDNFDDYSMLCKIVSNEIIIGKYSEYSITFTKAEEVKRLIQKCELNGSIDITLELKDVEEVFYNQSVIFDKKVCKFLESKILNVEKVLKKIEYFEEGDQIIIRFGPSKESNAEIGYFYRV